MKLVTIQTKQAYDELISKGYLVANANCINKPKYGVPYQFIINHMDKINNEYSAEFPLWVWVKYGGFISPPKNKLLGFFSKDEAQVVRITFEKPDGEVLVTDYTKYHFLLTNEYLPKTKQDYIDFEKTLQDSGVTKQDLLMYVRRDKYPSFRQDKVFENINKTIHNSYQDIFSADGKYLQGTVWDIKLSEVTKVEFVDKATCTKKSPVDYRKLHIKSLK